MLRQDWTLLRLRGGVDIRAAIQAIDKNRLGIAFVVDEQDLLLGTVTDGDIRRAILRDIPVTAPVVDIMSRNFIAVEEGASADEARALMQMHRIDVVPVLAGGHIRGLFTLRDMLEVKARPNWAIIMAGGTGRRLRPLTDNVPKPMLPVGDQPILEIIVRRLVSHGIRRIFLSVNYLGEQIERYFGDGSAFDCEINYLRESQPMDTGGALSLLPETPSDPFLVVNGDLLTDVNYAALLDFHDAHEGPVTLCVREYEQETPFGVVRCDGDEVVDIVEKPVQKMLINAGIYVIESRLLGQLPQARAYSLPHLIAKSRVHGDKVYAFLVHEQWLDIGQPDDYARAAIEFQERTRDT